MVGGSIPWRGGAGGGAGGTLNCRHVGGDKLGTFPKEDNGQRSNNCPISLCNLSLLGESKLFL